MKNYRTMLLTAALIGASLTQNSAMACAACYGRSDAPMAQGLNAGIFTLLGVIGSVLAGAVVFFVYIARRASLPSPPAETPSH